ncbi:MAG: hypothetical protein U0L18_07695 [Acutalibacteraceae bacterium]|nr:hypothetical protein [Acutalibacteraceae bacterium]
MTSTISSNNTKKPFLGMLLWSLKKALPITLVYSFLLFVCNPMYITLAKNNAPIEEFDYVEAQLLSIGFTAYIIVIFTIITAVSMFSIYHKKRSIDLYASFPINKQTLFLARYFSGLIITIVPLVIFTILGLFSSGQINSENTFVTFCRLIDSVVSIINMYSMLSLISMICGSKVDTLVTFGVVNVAFVGLILTGANLVVNMLPGLYNMDYQIYESTTYMSFFTFCPVAMPFISGAFSSVYGGIYTPVYNGEDYYDKAILAGELKVLAIWFVLAVVYFVLATLIAKKRRNENVQNGFIFNFPKHIIQVIASLSAGMMLGSFIATYFCTYSSGFETMLVFMLGALIGTALVYLIFTLIYNKGEKRFVKGLPAFGATFVILAVFYLSISSGLVGVASAPKVDSIESVCVLSSDNDYDFYGEVTPIIHTKGNEFEKTDLFIKDKTVIKNAVELHQAILDGLHEESGAFFNIYNNYSIGVANNTGYEPHTIRIEYNLNNGKRVYQNYVSNNFNYDKIKDKYNAVISSDVYKNNYKLVKCADPVEANISGIDFSSAERYTNVDTRNPETYTDINGNITYEDKEYLEPVDIDDSKAMNQIYSTLREEFIADKNYAETLKAKDCKYVKPTESNSAIYDEIVFNIDITYNEAAKLYPIVDNKAEELGVTPGYTLDPIESFVITKEAYPKTWELLNSYCVNENTDQVYMFPNELANS